jgi:hypothetical protein
MDSLMSRRTIIRERKKKLEEKFGTIPILYGSGVEFDAEKIAGKIKIRLNPKVIKNCFSNDDK